jgi:hypothetical protein
MNDFVNRQDLLDGIEELKQSPWFKNGEDKQDIQHYGYLERKEAVEVVTDLCIKKEPSVTPKEKTGKWINDWEMGMSECSCCGETYLWEDHKGTENFHYCPNCGARMVSE